MGIIFVHTRKEAAIAARAAREWRDDEGDSLKAYPSGMPDADDFYREYVMNALKNPYNLGGLRDAQNYIAEAVNEYRVQQGYAYNSQGKRIPAYD
jgi:hypothetical protein